MQSVFCDVVLCNGNRAKAVYRNGTGGVVWYRGDGVIRCSSYDYYCVAINWPAPSSGFLSTMAIRFVLDIYERRKDWLQLMTERLNHCKGQQRNHGVELSLWTLLVCRDPKVKQGGRVSCWRLVNLCTFALFFFSIYLCFSRACVIGVVGIDWRFSSWNMLIIINTVCIVNRD